MNIQMTTISVLVNCKVVALHDIIKKFKLLNVFYPYEDLYEEVGYFYYCKFDGNREKSVDIETTPIALLLDCDNVPLRNIIRKYETIRCLYEYQTIAKNIKNIINATIYIDD